jgi:hypothetical protein
LKHQTEVVEYECRHGVPRINVFFFVSSFDPCVSKYSKWVEAWIPLRIMYISPIRHLNQINIRVPEGIQTDLEPSSGLQIKQGKLNLTTTYTKRTPSFSA